VCGSAPDYAQAVPELPEVEAERRRLAPSMVRARITAVDLRRPDLRRPFPERFAGRLTGRRVLALTRRAKYLLATLSSGETLLMHLGMSGSFRLVRDRRAARHASEPADVSDPHDHVVLHMSSGKAVVFNDPRRFGMMDLVSSADLDGYPALSALGPEPLSTEFDAAALARACRGRKTSLKAALLDQRVVAGLGNIYASEALHVAGLSPRRPVSTLATRTGAPREAAHRLVAAIKQVLESAIARQSGVPYRDSRFLVYDRQDERCRRKNCGGTIRRRTQGGRSTFYCPVCQR
jgi:formamidopyrimidine-DNA glycosylase